MGLLDKLNAAAEAASDVSDPSTSRRVVIQLVAGGVRIIGTEQDAEMVIIADWAEILSATINTLEEKIEMVAFGLGRAIRDRDLLLVQEDNK